MKRGLKVTCLRVNRIVYWSSRAFPDEEGTESWRFHVCVSKSSSVPEPSPMKRGLKDGRRYGLDIVWISSRAFPDEEGTERWDVATVRSLMTTFQSLPR